MDSDMSTFRCLNCGGVYDDVARTGELYFHGCPELLDDRGDKLPDDGRRRVENLSPPILGRPLIIISEGLGVECLSKPPVSEPAWIAGLKRIAAKQEDE